MTTPTCITCGKTLTINKQSPHKIYCNKYCTRKAQQLARKQEAQTLTTCDKCLSIKTLENMGWRIDGKERHTTCRTCRSQANLKITNQKKFGGSTSHLFHIKDKIHLSGSLQKFIDETIHLSSEERRALERLAQSEPARNFELIYRFLERMTPQSKCHQS